MMRLAARHGAVTVNLVREMARIASLREKRVYDTDVTCRWLRCRKPVSAKRLRAVLPLDAPTWGWDRLESRWRPLMPMTVRCVASHDDIDPNREIGLWMS